MPDILFFFLYLVIIKNIENLEMSASALEWFGKGGYLKVRHFTVTLQTPRGLGHWVATQIHFSDPLYMESIYIYIFFFLIFLIKKVMTQRLRDSRSLPWFGVVCRGLP